MFELLSPAKLNLFLHIIGQRADGYHELQTAFQFLDYCDVLSFEMDKTGAISRVDDAPKYQDDLILKAANLLKSITKTPSGVVIKLTKNLPTGGGLGGGSSNAATTLVGLNRLWGLNLSTETLAKIGLRIGADVPIFVYGFAAFAEGIGEVFTKISPPECWFLVVNPNIHISTLKIFCSKELTRDSTRIKIPCLFKNLGRNDCLLVVQKMYPKVKKAMDWLDQFADAKLTGTGACIFASFTNKTQAEIALKQLPDAWDGFIAKGKNRSLLYE